MVILSNAWNSFTTSSSPNWKWRCAVSPNLCWRSKRIVSNMACVFENDSVGNHACFLDANEWFVAQKLEDFEKLYKGYITRTFHSADLTIPNLIGEWIAADTIKIMDLERRGNMHRRYVFLPITRLQTYTRFSVRVCNKMLGEVCINLFHYAELCVLTGLA